MSRHILIGTGADVSLSNGEVGNGAIMIQKVSSAGPTELVLGDTLVDSDQIRFVQGTASGKANVVSPWVYGKDVINWSGKSYAAASVRDETYTISALTATASGEASIKLLNITNGEEPFAFKSYTTAYAIGATATTIADALKALIAADQPTFANCDNTGDSDATLDFSGFATGATDNAGNIVLGLPTDFKVVFEDVNPTDAARTISAAVVGSYSPGVGMAYEVKSIEESLQGVGFGFYNRIHQPIAPDSYADISTPTGYDMYSIVATKDGSSHSQVHGVDNLIDITFAIKNGQSGGITFENMLNGYFAGIFPTVTL